MAVREHSTKGTWALMSKIAPLLKIGWDQSVHDYIVLHLQSCHANVSYPKELQQKYEDPEVVKDLIRRKTVAGQYECNPDFPDSAARTARIYNIIYTILPFHHSNIVIHIYLL